MSFKKTPKHIALSPLEQGSRKLDRFFSGHTSPQMKRKIEKQKEQNRKERDAQLNDPKEIQLQKEYAKAGGWQKWKEMQQK
jgi:hypothetical protein